MSHRAITLVKHEPCPVCDDTRVVHLVEHWTGLDIGPATVACPHCLFPYVAVQSYYRRAS